MGFAVCTISYQSVPMATTGSHINAVIFLLLLICIFGLLALSPKGHFICHSVDAKAKLWQGSGFGGHVVMQKEGLTVGNLDQGTPIKFSHFSFSEGFVHFCLFCK